MSKDQELLIKINGTAKNFTDEIDKAKAKTKDLERSLATTAKVSTVAFVALAGAVAGTVARFSNFEKGFTNVVTLLDQGSFKTKNLKDGINGLKEGVIALSAQSGESFEILNQGLFDLVSSGVEAEKAVDTLTAATQLAIAGATDTATAVKALAATLTAYGDEAGTATEIAEKFFTAQKFGVTTVGELATEFNKVGGIAKTLGISFDETLASLSSLTADGAKPTAQAATQLRAAFNSLILVQSKLVNESAEIRDALDLENVKRRGLVKSLDLLKTATGGNVAEIQRLVGSSEALAVVLSLTGGQSDLVAKQIDEIGNAASRSTVFQEALATKQATVEQTMKRLKQAGDAVAVTFGEVFAPALNALATALTAVASTFAGFSKSTIQIIAVVTGIVAGFTGLIAVVSTLVLGYIKLQRAVIAANAALNIAGNIQKAYNLTLALGTKAVAIFRAGVIAATTTVRGFAAATGIGLVLVALSLMISNLDKTRAVAAGTFAALSTIVKNFASGIFQTLGGVGNLLVGVFTLDKDRILKGLSDIKNGLVTRSLEIGKGAGDAFSKAYNESIAGSLAADAPAPNLPGVGGTDPKDPADAGGKDESLDNLISKEQEAAARVREIRERENDLLKQQAARANLDREEILDQGLKKIQEEEKKAADQRIKNKQGQLQFLKDIDRIENENAQLAIKERLSATEQVQLEANQRQLGILKEQLQAAQNVEAENADLLAQQEQERAAQKLDRIQQQFDEEQALQEELQELTDEQRELLDEQEVQKFRDKIQSKRDIEREAVAEELQENLNRRKNFIKDEQRFGKEVAQLNRFFAQEEVQLAGETANSLVRLTQSKNQTLKGIGKAASLVQIGIKTAEGAISAYSSLAGIPIVGPALGIAAASALIAFGGEQAAAVLSAKRGGIVPSVGGGSRDRVPMMLEPGEAVVPRALVPDFQQKFGSPEAGGTASGGVMDVVVGFRDEAFEIIEQKLIERRRIDGVGLGALG